MLSYITLIYLNMFVLEFSNSYANEAIYSENREVFLYQILYYAPWLYNEIQAYVFNNVGIGRIEL